MKKIFIYLLFFGLISACENQEQPYEEDFDFQGVYFPFQLPIRTLSLGEDRLDNSLDKEFKFEIAVSIGGMYENKKNWTADYVVDNSLTDSVYHSVTGIKIKPLPSAYYSMNPLNTITIPKGLFNGRVMVQLTEAFFDDTIALTGMYVVPLRITNTTADSILSGSPVVSNPDKRISSDWNAGKLPRDWVMYGIKYINSYHGSYLQRGRDIKYSGTTPIDTVVYHTKHVEQGTVVAITSIGKTRAVSNFIDVNISLTGKYAMILEFANMWGIPGGSITIKPRVGSTYSVTGTGQYFDKAASAESIIGLKMPSMHLNYTYNDGVNVHQVTDTLVFRDRGMKFEENTIIVKKP